MPHSTDEGPPPLVRMEAPPPYLPDAALVALALDPAVEDNHCYWDELERRARSGNLGMQRLAAHLGLRGWAEGRITVEILLNEFEPFARMASASKGEADLATLTSYLAVRADQALEQGDSEALISAEAEGLMLAGRIAMQIEDPAMIEEAVNYYRALADAVPEEARLRAEVALEVIYASPCLAEPEVAAIQRLKERRK